ncbi:MAG: DUF3089 domain-containing protein [Desulfarculaceae bacterium]|nr:DUF3089 domain-containing protein [Desulfarculaceae bacterium]
MKLKRIRALLAAMLLAVCLAAMAQAAGPDYASDYNWTIREAKPLKAYDVFYVHPTTYGDTADGLNQSLDNKKVRAATEATTRQQIGAYNARCNVFAPRYRQVSIKVLGMKEAEGEPYKQIATDDVLAALKYFLKNLNQGRPYIIAAHSQGSMITLRLLKAHRDLINDKKLIAAYLPGWTFTDADLKAIKLPFAQSPTQTGCVLAWNTIAQGGKSPTLFAGAHCINPLSWSTDHKEQPASKNIYALIDMGDGTTKKIPHFTSARIGDNGGLIIPVPSIVDQLNMSMGAGVFHRYDIDFFYGNIAQNVNDRCVAWQRKQPAP